jgi:hypothetical protein
MHNIAHRALPLKRRRAPQPGLFPYYRPKLPLVPDDEPPAGAVVDLDEGVWIVQAPHRAQLER